MTTLDTDRHIEYRADNMPATLTTRRSNTAGRKLRSRRLNQGLSPEQLGDRLGISGRTIRRVEAGQMVPTPRTMFALAEWAEQEVVDLWRL